MDMRWPRVLKRLDYEGYVAASVHPNHFITNHANSINPLYTATIIPDRRAKRPSILQKKGAQSERLVTIIWPPLYIFIAGGLDHLA